jgi:hypothetical protein
LQGVEAACEAFDKVLGAIEKPDAEGSATYLSVEQAEFSQGRPKTTNVRLIWFHFEH